MDTNIQKLLDTCKYIPDEFHASVEYPAYIGIETGGLYFAFGHANRDFGYDFSPIDDLSCPKEGTETISHKSNPVEMAAFITKQIKKTLQSSDSVLL